MPAPRKPSDTRLTFQATHHYEAAEFPRAVDELVETGKQEMSEALKESAPLKRADRLYSALASGLPSLIATGVPVAGDQLVLPASWNWCPQTPVLVGRNPYNSPLLQAVEAGDIISDDNMDKLSAVQYSLTGYHCRPDRDPVLEFYKGIVVIVPDQFMPPSVDMMLSTKDKKLCELWQTLDDKTKDQSSDAQQDIELRGVFVVKEKIPPGQLFGLPLKLAKAVGGDYDGDQFNLVPTRHLPGLHRMVKTVNGRQPINAKLDKTFTRCTEDGNYARILQIRGNLLERWSVISNVVQALPIHNRKQLVTMVPAQLRATLNMSPSARSADKETDQGGLLALQSEIQLGIKCGEDVYKTTVPYALAISQAQRYEQVLRQWNPQLSVPYAKGLQRRLRLADTSAKLRQCLNQLENQPLLSTNPSITGVALTEILKQRGALTFQARF